MKVKIGKRKHSFKILWSKYIRGAVYAKFSGFVFLRLQRNKRDQITLMGHTYSGNGKAFAEYLQQAHPEIGVIFATDDPAYYKLMRNTDRQDPKVYSLQNLKHLWAIAGSKVICTTHGPVFLKYWAHKKHAPLFIELWHGAGFKNRTPDDNRDMLFYDAVFVSSPVFKEFHNKWGYEDRQLYVTGYAQVDYLVKSPSAAELKKIRSTFGIETGKRVVLYAPTWSTRSNSNSSPFNNTIDHLIEELGAVAEKHQAQILVLPHINSSLKIPKIPNVTVVSGSGDLDIKPLLHVVDVLITDWSSVYTDFLALPKQKPVIFLDTNPTFYGFTLTPSDRAGQVVSNVEDLTAALEQALDQPSLYLKNYSSKIKSVTKKVWGNTLDGKSAERYFSVIKGLIDEQ